LSPKEYVMLMNQCRIHSQLHQRLGAVAGYSTWVR
jgi:hypothetical protein